MASSPRVAIVGRPNVGKSTLFNRLIRRRRAITLDTPGVTRDAVVEEVEWDGRKLRLIDTGGLRGEAEIQLAQQVHDHTVKVIESADIVVVLLDAKAGINPLDADTVELVLHSRRPAIYVANKADGPRDEESLVEFCNLGIDMPLAVSAEHGVGISELKREISSLLDSLEAAEELLAAAGAHASSGAGSPDNGDLDGEQDSEPGAGETQPPPCRVALVGRPNVGKSSLLNLIAGEALSLVDDTPGTTRDVVDTAVTRGARRYVFLDTAGMRRPSRVERGVERISVGRSLEVIDRANVVVLLIEPSEGLSDQDARIARRAWDEGRALVILMNKIDMLPPRAPLEAIRTETLRRAPSLRDACMAFISVVQNRGIEDCFAAIDRAQDAHNRQIPTAVVNRVLAAAAERRQPPVLSGGRLKILYGTQTALRPPTITLYVNRKDVPTAYERFLERCLREEITLQGSPLRLRFVRRDSHGSRRA